MSESLTPREIEVARAAVSGFLQQVSGGEKIALCENEECRVIMYRVPSAVAQVAPGRVTKLPICPGCYGSPSPRSERTQGL